MIPPVRIASAAPATEVDAPPEAGAPVLDPVWLERLADLERASGKALVSVVVGEFKAAAPRRLREIREALADQDGDSGRSVSLVVHGLKGASASLGAAGVAALCRVIEEKAKAGDLAQLGPLVDTLEQELAASSAAMESWLAEVGSGWTVPS
jgi:HPt (histidine-containing phosphotransfer) domain-containing protein